MSQELTSQQLRKVCDPQTLNIIISADQKASNAIIGQERAARSLKFGLGIQALPARWGRQIQSDMKTLVDSAQQELRKAFNSAEYTAKRNETTSSYDRQVWNIIAGINAKAQQEGFAIQETPMGFMTVPIRWGHPMTQTEYMLLRQSDKDAISQKQEELRKEIEAAVRQEKTLDKTAGEELQKMDRQIALYALNYLFDEMKGKYQGFPEILAYLDRVQEDILEHVDNFRADPASQQNVLFRHYSHWTV